MDTVAALFAAELAALNVPPNRVSPTKQRYPKLNGAESAQLLELQKNSASWMVAFMPNGVSTPAEYVGISTVVPGLYPPFLRAIPAKSSGQGNLC
uniref:Uncharacterized protein n=1 Tax=Peronospora matthiolae TaxID=2874970 RepID=A0AAV1V533_9STRA